jgi:hypothetical protein
MCLARHERRKWGVGGDSCITMTEFMKEGELEKVDESHG